MNRTLNTIESTYPNSDDVLRKKGSFLPQRIVNSDKQIRQNTVNKNAHSQKNQNSFAVFKYLIIITSIIFSFGGLGFGLAWRYGQDVQLSQSEMNNHSANAATSVSQQ